MATAVGHIPVTTTKENENYAQLSRAIVDLMTFILREILMLYILPADIETNALSSSKLNNLRAEQWDLIHKANTNGYNDFDITLLYTLLRNLCASVPKPSTKWGRNDLPKNHEVTLGDDIERIRIVKNGLQSHIPTTILNDADFEDYWKILRDVCVRLDLQFNKKYTNDLDKLKTICMDSVLQKEYRDKVQLLKNREIKNSVEIVENTCKLTKHTSEIKDNTSRIKDNTSKIKDNTSKIKDNKSRIKDNTSQIEDITRQIRDHTSQIKDNTSQITEHTSQIMNNTIQIKDNTGQIKDNTSQIKDNTSQIKYNTSQIKDNTIQIKNNTIQIEDNTSQIKEHTSQIQGMNAFKEFISFYSEVLKFFNCLLSE